MINEFQGDYRFLSNFHPAEVEMDGIKYPSVEHAYQAAKSLDKDERILGTYLIGNSQLQHPDYENLKGVEGVLLAVDDSLRGHGWGSRMKDYPKTLGVDYIWGYQATGLNNLNEWLKRRELIAESELVYVTAEKYDKRKH